MSLDFKRFTEGDWTAFAGAEKFEDGTDPLIAELKVDGEPAIAIVDQTGMAIFWTNEKDDWTSYSACIKGQTAALLLKVDMGKVELEARGFCVEES